MSFDEESLMLSKTQNIADEISDDSDDEPVGVPASQLRDSSFRLHETLFQSTEGDDENIDGNQFTKDFKHAGAPGFRAPQLSWDDPDDYSPRHGHSSTRGSYVEVNENDDDY